MLGKLEDWWVEREPTNLLMYRNMVDRIELRKMRLFVCGSCRLIWDLLPNEYCRQMVEGGERYADGLMSEPELSFLSGRWILAGSGLDRASRAYDAFRSTRSILQSDFHPLAVGIGCIRHTRLASEPQDHPALAVAQCDLIRDLFDVPDRVELFQARCLTWEVVNLARHIEDNRAFDLMPILGDALEEAGCFSTWLLDHCRSSKPHARGCWVLDGLLGRPRSC